MTHASTRWSHLVRHGLVGTTLLGAAVERAEAEACQDVAERSIGFVIGVDLSPRARLIGGVEARACLADGAEALVRIEIGGPPRLIAGARVRPYETTTEERVRERFSLEGGLVLDTHSQFGLHAAATLGDQGSYLALQTAMSLSAETPTRYSLLGGFSPWVLEENREVGVPGRPLRHGGRYVTPRVAARHRACASAEQRAVRDYFVGAAQLELSSVWTFLRLAQELVALGAPAALVAAALDAADDEIRHAEMCAHAAGDVALAGLPIEAARPRFTRRSSRARALAVLAAEAWREGCLNEAAAAEEARLAAADTDGATRAMLSTIAVDERRHAELSWAVLDWALAIDPSLARTVLAAPADGETTAGEGPAYDRALARHGVPSPTIRAAAYAHARQTALERVGGRVMRRA